MFLERLELIKNNLLNNSNIIMDFDQLNINLIVESVINQELNDDYSMMQVRLILEISDILYNNSNNLIIEDGIYDILLNVYKKYNPSYDNIGGIPVNIPSNNNDISNNSYNEMINPITILEPKEDNIFINEYGLLNSMYPQDINTMITPITILDENNSKKLRNVSHDYPNLVGTLDKCKYVLHKEALKYNDLKAAIFERDFISRHVQMGILNTNNKFGMVCELKYDGISIEATLDGSDIISCRTRGDVKNDLGADVTSILKHYKFPNAECMRGYKVGMKFEAIINKYNLEKLSQIKGVTYKNSRNAIIGIMGSLDGYKYVDLITLVPLQIDCPNLDLRNRMEEIMLINQLYAKNEYLRFGLAYGNYVEVLFQIDRFLKEAESLRNYLPFMYDGIVVSYDEEYPENIKEKLGVQNNIKKYSMAIKFNPSSKETTFYGYTYSIGQNGIIVPKAHYKPVEFFGNVQSKTTVHSYNRFKELSLRPGDIIDITYNNDIMSYITKSNNLSNDNNMNPILEFPTHCPYCNEVLLISDSGNTIQCINDKCRGIQAATVENMMDKLGIKGFAEATVLSLIENVKGLRDLCELQYDDVKHLGPNNADDFLNKIKEFKNTPILDYKVMGAIGFTNIAEQKWKLILSVIQISDLLNFDDNQLYEKLHVVKGLGEATINVILNERLRRIADIEYAAFELPIITSNNPNGKIQIRFSGVRGFVLEEELSKLGYDISNTAGVTKNTRILIVPHEGFTSTKTEKVSDICIIVSYDKFMNNMKEILGEIK